MFKNPLKKYQQGGQVSQEQQQMLAAFVEWLPKRVKEFQGMRPEQIVEALNGMAKSPEGQKQVQAYMQQFQQEMQNPQAGMFKEGGKLQDFICKHAKGGHVAGCGCKEDGGKVEKAQKGESLEDSAPEYLYNENGVPSEFNRYTSRPGRMLYAEVPTPKGNINFEFNQLNGAVPGGLNLPVEYDVQTRSMLDDPEGSVGIQRLPLYQMPYFSKLKKQGTQYEEDGGVVKGQEGVVTPTLSRREALAAAKNTFGFNGSQARRAYANAKRGLRAQGLRGSELKQRAREMMFNMPSIDDEITIEEPQIQLSELPALDTNTPSVQPIQPIKSIQDTDPLAGMTDEQLAKAVMAGKYGNGAARRKALGDRYAAVQQIVNRGFSKPATPTASAATSSRVATSATTTPANSSSTSPVGTASTPSYGQIYGNISGGFVPQNTPEDLGFRINSNRPASSFGARQSIINRQVKDYIDGAGLGIGTDIVFDNGRYIWRNSGAPVEVPMMGRNGNYRPAVERNGGVVKGQNGIPEGMPSPGNVDLFGRITPYNNPVSTQPLDSAKVKLNNGNLIFTDINGNHVSWHDLGNGNWTYRNGNDIMDFSTSQSEGFKPYSKFKAWNRATSGSTKLSEKDNNDLNNLKNKTKNRK